MQAPVLETERLVLRPIRREDAVAIQKYFPQWDIIKNLATQVPWPYPDDGAQTWVNSILNEPAEGPDITWAITERGKDLLIGVIDYRAGDLPAGNRGFWLGIPWHGYGYMTEAVFAMQDHLFLECGIERIIVENALTNKASRRIKEKTGARLLGLVEFEHHNGCSATEKWEVTRWIQNMNILQIKTRKLWIMGRTNFPK